MCKKCRKSDGQVYKNATNRTVRTYLLCFLTSDKSSSNPTSTLYFEARNENMSHKRQQKNVMKTILKVTMLSLKNMKSARHKNIATNESPDKTLQVLYTKSCIISFLSFFALPCQNALPYFLRPPFP